MAYSLAAACVALFVYLAVVVMLATAAVGDGGLWVWSLSWCGIPLVLNVVLALYVRTKPYPGGYVLVGLGCLIGAFMCIMALTPMLIF